MFLTYPQHSAYLCDLNSPITISSSCLPTLSALGHIVSISFMICSHIVQSITMNRLPVNPGQSSSTDPSLSWRRTHPFLSFCPSCTRSCWHTQARQLSDLTKSPTNNDALSHQGGTRIQGIRVQTCLHGPRSSERRILQPLLNGDDEQIFAFVRLIELLQATLCQCWTFPSILSSIVLQASSKQASIQCCCLLHGGCILVKHFRLTDYAAWAGLALPAFPFGYYFGQ